MGEWTLLPCLSVRVCVRTSCNSSQPSGAQFHGFLSTERKRKEKKQNFPQCRAFLAAAVRFKKKKKKRTYRFVFLKICLYGRLSLGKLRSWQVPFPRLAGGNLLICPSLNKLRRKKQNLREPQEIEAIG